MIGYNPTMVTDGLVLCLDAANGRSYPGSGTAWNDLSGNGNNGTLVNGPTYSVDNLGYFSFDGVNDEVTLGDTLGNFGNDNFTISFWTKTSDSGGNKCFIAKSIGGSPVTNYGWLLNNANSSEIGFAMAGSNYSSGGWAATVGAYSVKTNGLNITSNIWKFVSVVADRSSIDVNIYVNGNLANVTDYVGGKGKLNTVGSVSNTRILKIGAESDNLWINALIPQVSIYNRALSPAEIQQNFNATRGRFGI
jgi:hypothetical protein